ncbi:MAG: OmpA family protein [Campylobacteraceae bacterium]|jgi:outer membrane protein OmpA-like peptidoglycan-associated protein|nr:OmpA family protein [Campylobacteraceae bacterium]
MKKVVFVILGLVFTAMAAEGGYEITPTISGVFPEKNTELQNYLSVGLRAGQYFNGEFINKIEIGAETARAYYNEGVVSNTGKRQAIITRYFVHAIKEFEINKNLYFYALAGAGYENIMKKARYGNNDSPYGNYGVGFRYALTDDFYLRTEVRHAIKLHSHDADNNILATFGISYALSEKSKSEANEPLSHIEPEAVKNEEILIEISEKNIEEIQSIDEQIVIETTKQESIIEEPIVEIKEREEIIVEEQLIAAESEENKSETENEKASAQTVDGETWLAALKDAYTKEPSESEVVEVDSDNDGIADTHDLCPDTPLGFNVDSVGCVKSITLHVNFSSGKADIQGDIQSQIESVAKILISETDYKVVLEGHTDSSGSKKINMKLSEQRVKKIASELVRLGVSESRIFVEWFGPEKPIAGNDTEEGRAQNRRVEAFFIK